MGRKIKVSEEPILEAARYVVVIHVTKRGRHYRHLMNREAVRELKRQLKPGTVIEVFKASYDFKEAWVA